MRWPTIIWAAVLWLVLAIFVGAVATIWDEAGWPAGISAIILSALLLVWGATVWDHHGRTHDDH